ncbi:hypothetical protein [Cryobacterium arcticum]|nr:hypothetical protein [Cryobacterium arcticum]
MLLTIEDRPNALLELLWIREAHALRLQGEDLPPLLLDTPTTVQHAALSTDTRDEWASAWPRIWHAVVAYAGPDLDSRLFVELQATAIGSTERASLLHRIVGPSWRDDFGDSAFENDSYRAWSQVGMDAQLAAMATRIEDSPERRDLPPLISAWHAGLTKIVTIPCLGEFTRRISENALLMTAGTRANSDSYRRALNTFI